MFYIFIKIPTTSSAHSKKPLVTIDKEVPVSFRVRLLDLRWALMNEWFSIPDVYVYLQFGTLYPCPILQKYNNKANFVFKLGPEAKTWSEIRFLMRTLFEKYLLKIRFDVGHKSRLYVCKYSNITRRYEE